MTFTRRISPDASSLRSGGNWPGAEGLPAFFQG
jgi:hypothetical protein